jgi:multicomponent Na+:H+ antiporter subunit G
MGWSDAADVAAGLLLALGCLLSLIAAVGMVRLPDLLSRMHAATKPQTLGLVLVLCGLALRLRDVRSLGLLALVVLFQLSTAPIASHMVGRAAFRAGQTRRDLLVVDELSEVVQAEEERRDSL